MYRPPRHRHRHRRTIVLLLAAVLVVVQMLGTMHTVLHDHARAGPTQASAPSAGAAVDTSVAAAAVRPARDASSIDPSGFGSLFSGHDSQADCDHFDHISHADLVGFDVVTFVAAHGDRPEAPGRRGWHIAQQAAGFLARGPPIGV